LVAYFEDGILTGQELRANTSTLFEGHRDLIDMFELYLPEELVPTTESGTNRSRGGGRAGTRGSAAGGAGVKRAGVGGRYGSYLSANYYYPDDDYVPRRQTKKKKKKKVISFEATEEEANVEENAEVGVVY
jgi:hypothetical protein